MRPWLFLLSLLLLGAGALVWFLSVPGRFWIFLGIFFAVSFALIALLGFFLSSSEARVQRQRKKRRKRP